MTLPGVEVQTVDASAPRGPQLRLSTPFIAGDLGGSSVSTEVVPIRSLRDLTSGFGSRATRSAAVYDWCDDYFHEGGGLAYVVNLATTTPDADGLTAAGALFAQRLGAGTGVLPGITDTALQLAYAEALNVPFRSRVVKCDLATADAADVVTDSATLRASEYADMLDVLVGRLSIPGLANGTSRDVPLSALRCGAEARNEAAGLSPNQPAAGRWAISQWGTALDHEWTDDDRETLNDAGVNVAITDQDGIKLFGARTAIDPTVDPAGVRLGSVRLRSEIIDIARTEGGAINFAEIDQGGVELGHLAGQIRGRILTRRSSLYFLSVDAYLVEDTPGVYVVEVAIEFQASPDAERVRVIVTRAVTQV